MIFDHAVNSLLVDADGVVLASDVLLVLVLLEEHLGDVTFGLQDTLIIVPGHVNILPLKSTISTLLNSKLGIKLGKSVPISS